MCKQIIFEKIVGIIVISIIIILTITSCSSAGRYLSDLEVLSPREMQRRWGNPEYTDRLFYDCGEDSSRVRCVEVQSDAVEITIYAWKMKKLSNGKNLWIKFEVESEWNKSGNKFYHYPDSVGTGHIYLIEF